jgi:hypothetical protein
VGTEVVLEIKLKKSFTCLRYQALFKLSLPLKMNISPFTPAYCSICSGIILHTKIRMNQEANHIFFFNKAHMHTDVKFEPILDKKAVLASYF